MKIRSRALANLICYEDAQNYLIFAESLALPDNSSKEVVLQLTVYVVTSVHLVGKDDSILEETKTTVDHERRVFRFLVTEIQLCRLLVDTL